MLLLLRKEDDKRVTGGVEHISYYIPDARKEIASLGDLLGLQNEDFTLLTNHGLKQIAVEDELRLDQMLFEAVRPLFEQGLVQPQEVDMLLFTSTILQFSPHLVDPFSKIRQQFRLEHAQVLAVNQVNCAGMDFLFQITMKMLRLYPHVNGVLLVTGDKTFVKDFRYMKDSSVMADAASAAFISRQTKTNRIIDSLLTVEGTIYNGEKSLPEDLVWFQRTFAMGLIKIVRSMLKKNHLDVEHIRLLIVSNINDTTWKKVAQALKVPSERLYYPTLSEIGHAHNTDPLIHLDMAVKEGRLRQGDYFMTLTAGNGSTFGCTLFQH